MEINPDFKVMDWHFPDRELSEWKNRIKMVLHQLKEKCGFTNMIYVPLRMTSYVRDDFANLMRNFDIDGEKIAQGIEKPEFRKKIMK